MSLSLGSKGNSHFGPKIEMSPNKFPQKQVPTSLSKFNVQKSYYQTRNSFYNSDYLSIPSCTICLEPFQSEVKDKRPLCLPYCGHTLCEACLKHLISSSSEAITCHICKRVNPLSAHRSIDSFPPSWAIIDSIRNTVSVAEIEVHTMTNCSHCEYREASHWCVYHTIKLCAYCSFTHAKECKADKVVELNSANDYFKKVADSHKNLLSEVKNKIEIATKAKETFLMEVVPKLNQLVLEIDEIKLSAIKNFDFFIVQLEELQNKIIKHCFNEDITYEALALKVNDNKTLKQHLKFISDLEDTLKRYRDQQLNYYEINISFDKEIYESIHSLMSKMFNARFLSPYLPEPTSSISDALFEACENGNIVIIDFILTVFQENPNKRNNVGMTAFNIAVKNQLVELYHKLFEVYRVDVNIPDNIGRSPLIYACMNGDKEGVKYLVRKCKVNTNSLTKWKDTPLHCAAENGNIDIIRVLVNEGKADVSAVNERGKTPKEVADDSQIRQFLTLSYNRIKETL